MVDTLSINALSDGGKSELLASGTSDLGNELGAREGGLARVDTGVDEENGGLVHGARVNNGLGVGSLLDRELTGDLNVLGEGSAILLDEGNLLAVGTLGDELELALAGDSVGVHDKGDLELTSLSLSHGGYTGRDKLLSLVLVLEDGVGVGITNGRDGLTSALVSHLEGDGEGVTVLELAISGEGGLDRGEAEVALDLEGEGTGITIKLAEGGVVVLEGDRGTLGRFVAEDDLEGANGVKRGGDGVDKLVGGLVVVVGLSDAGNGRNNFTRGGDNVHVETTGDRLALDVRGVKGLEGLALEGGRNHLDLNILTEGVVVGVELELSGNSGQGELEEDAVSGVDTLGGGNGEGEDEVARGEVHLVEGVGEVEGVGVLTSINLLLVDDDERAILDLEDEVEVAREELGLSNSAEGNVENELSALGSRGANVDLLTIEGGLGGNGHVVADRLGVSEAEEELVTKVGDVEAEEGLDLDAAEEGASLPDVAGGIAGGLAVPGELDGRGLLALLDVHGDVEAGVPGTPDGADEEDRGNLGASSDTVGIGAASDGLKG